jgi:hypothetical protein
MRPGQVISNKKLVRAFSVGNMGGMLPNYPREFIGHGLGLNANKNQPWFIAAYVAAAGVISAICVVAMKRVP